MLELPRQERFRPRQVYGTEIHPVNLLKQLSLSWFLKVLPRYFVCTCHMTRIRHRSLIKTDTSVFPGKAPILRLQEQLSCFVCVIPARAAFLLNRAGRHKGDRKGPAALVLSGRPPTCHRIFNEDLTERGTKCPSGCCTEGNSCLSIAARPEQMLRGQERYPRVLSAPQGTPSSLRLTGC